MTVKRHDFSNFIYFWKSCISPDDISSLYFLMIGWILSWSHLSGYLLLGATTTVWMLFLSRVVVGVVKQTLTIAQAWITDNCPTTDERIRVRTARIGPGVMH